MRHRGLQEELGMSDQNEKCRDSKSDEGAVLRLIQNQEPLGEEFEKVLLDNLWELYDADLTKKNTL